MTSDTIGVVGLLFASFALLIIAVQALALVFSPLALAAVPELMAGVALVAAWRAARMRRAREMRGWALVHTGATLLTAAIILEALHTVNVWWLVQAQVLVRILAAGLTLGWARRLAQLPGPSLGKPSPGMDVFD